MDNEELLEEIEELKEQIEILEDENTNLENNNDDLKYDNEKLESKNEKLVQENAELKSKLEKSVELPCKVGDKVYIIEENSINQYIISGIDIKIAMACIIVEYNATICGNDFVWFLKDVIGEKVFFSRQEAEQALKGSK